MGKESAVALGKNKVLVETRESGKHKIRYNCIMRYMQLLIF